MKTCKQQFNVKYDGAAWVNMIFNLTSINLSFRLFVLLFQFLLILTLFHIN